MKWHVVFTPKAEKQFDALNDKTQKTILSELESLEVSPWSGDFKKVKGGKGQYRRRKGQWRIIFSLEETGAIEIHKIERKSDKTY